MTVIAKTLGLTLTDAPQQKNIDYILIDTYGNEFPISDRAEMNDIEVLFSEVKDK